MNTPIQFLTDPAVTGAIQGALLARGYRKQDLQDGVQEVYLKALRLFQRAAPPPDLQRMKALSAEIAHDHAIDLRRKATSDVATSSAAATRTSTRPGVRRGAARSGRRRQAARGARAAVSRGAHAPGRCRHPRGRSVAVHASGDRRRSRDHGQGRGGASRRDAPDLSCSHGEARHLAGNAAAARPRVGAGGRRRTEGSGVTWKKEHAGAK